MTNLDIKELIKIPYSCSPTSSNDKKRIAYLNNNLEHLKFGFVMKIMFTNHSLITKKELRWFHGLQMINGSFLV